MPILSSKSQVAIKIEAVPGTAEALAAANVILTTDLPTFEAGPTIIERNALSASFDERGVVVGARMGKIAFKMFMRGLSAASGSGNPTDFDTPLRCCSTNVVYSLTTPNEIATYNFTSSPTTNYATIAIYRDGKVYQIFGAQGNCVMTYKVGHPVELAF